MQNQIVWMSDVLGNFKGFQSCPFTASWFHFDDLSLIATEFSADLFKIHSIPRKDKDITFNPKKDIKAAKKAKINENPSKQAKYFSDVENWKPSVTQFSRATNSFRKAPKNLKGSLSKEFKQ